VSKTYIPPAAILYKGLSAYFHARVGRHHTSVMSGRRPPRWKAYLKK
jgi:hypothetical protein